MKIRETVLRILGLGCVPKLLKKPIARTALIRAEVFSFWEHVHASLSTNQLKGMVPARKRKTVVKPAYLLSFNTINIRDK
jgi:hypothetical protein